MAEPRNVVQIFYSGKGSSRSVLWRSLFGPFCFFVGRARATQVAPCLVFEGVGIEINPTGCVVPGIIWFVILQ